MLNVNNEEDRQENWKKKCWKKWDVRLFLKTKEILDDVLDGQDRLLSQIDKLYHYSSLEVLQKILENDDLRLSHAEYSNDQHEMEEARTLISKQLAGYAPGSFLAYPVDAYTH